MKEPWHAPLGGSGRRQGSWRRRRVKGAAGPKIKAAGPSDTLNADRGTQLARPECAGVTLTDAAGRRRIGLEQMLIRSPSATRIERHDDYRYAGRTIAGLVAR